MDLCENPSSIFVAILALIVSIATVYFSRKSVQSQLFVQIVEKESLYISEWNNSLDSIGEKDKMLQYINLFEMISLLYRRRELNRKITRNYFKSILDDLYTSKKEEIEENIYSGRLRELDKLLQEWNIKVFLT
jgi:hypothetical protein